MTIKGKKIKKAEYRTQDTEERTRKAEYREVKFRKQAGSGALDIDFVHHSWEGYALAEMVWVGTKFRVQKP